MLRSFGLAIAIGTIVFVGQAARAEDPPPPSNEDIATEVNKRDKWPSLLHAVLHRVSFQANVPRIISKIGAQGATFRQGAS